MPPRRWSIAWACTASPSSTTRSGPRSSTPRSTPPAGASCGRRRTTGDPVGVGGRGRRRRRGARPGPGRCRVPRRDHGRGAAPPGRGAGRHRARDGRARADLEQVVAADGRRRSPTGALALDAFVARRRPWCSSTGAAACTIGIVALAAAATGVDLTRPVAPVRAPGSGDRRSTGRRARSVPNDVATWRSLGLAVTSADLVGVMRGALDADDRLRPRAPAVRRRHRIVPGGPAPAGRRLRRHGGLPQHRAARRLGRRRAAGLRRAWLRRRPPRPTAPGPPARSARRPFRCTAASATPGSAWPTSSCAAPSCRATCSAASGPTWPGCSPPAASEPTMDFADSPEELEFRLRLREWLSSNNPGLPASSTADEYWAGQAAWHQTLYDAGLLRPVLADRGRRARPAERLRGDPRRGADHRRHAAAAERGLPGAGDPAPRQRGRAASLPAGPGERPRALVPGLQRARCRVGPGVAAHARGARRRRST